MRFGLDYSWGRPSIEAMLAEGVTFVCRYVSTPGNSKNLTRSEADALKAAGIDVVVIFETTVGRARSGWYGGREDARSAWAQAHDCGAPLGSPIYFAVDFDAQLSDQDEVNDYLRGAVSVLGKDRVGVYGGYWVVKRVLDASVCKYAWQTYAWSGGRWDNRAHIRQWLNGQKVGGEWVDFDHGMFDDIGQWPKEDDVEEQLSWALPLARWYVLDRRDETRPTIPAGMPPYPRWFWDIVGWYAETHKLNGPPVAFLAWVEWLLLNDGERPAGVPTSIPKFPNAEWWPGAETVHRIANTLAERAVSGASEEAAAKIAALRDQLAALEAECEAHDVETSERERRVRELLQKAMTELGA